MFRGNFWICSIALILAFLVLFSILPLGRPSDFGIQRTTVIDYTPSGEPVILYDYIYNGFDGVSKSFSFVLSALHTIISPVVYAYNVFFGTNYVFVPLYTSYSDGEYQGRAWVIFEGSTFAVNSFHDVVNSSFAPSALKVKRGDLLSNTVYVYIDGATTPLEYFIDAETPNGEDWIQYDYNLSALCRLAIIWQYDGNI